jgi:penicillin-binding protein 1A
MKRVSGGGLPSEIWGRFMRSALQGAQPQGLPGGLWRTSPGLAPFGTQPSASAPMASARPVPPAAAAERSRVPPQEKGFFERLFGG